MGGHPLASEPHYVEQYGPELWRRKTFPLLKGLWRGANDPFRTESTELFSAVPLFFDLEHAHSRFRSMVACA
jgi:hypothetical protein